MKSQAADLRYLQRYIWKKQYPEYIILKNQ